MGEARILPYGPSRLRAPWAIIPSLMSRPPKPPAISAPTPPEALGFEQALAELESLVERMEGASLTLEESLAAHQRGLLLARHCQQRLESARQQVKVLEGELLRELESGSDDDDE